MRNALIGVYLLSYDIFLHSLFHPPIMKRSLQARAKIIASVFLFTNLFSSIPLASFAPIAETVSAAALGCNNSSFDTFSLGSVDGQNGWSSTGSFDQEVVTNTYGYTEFGCQSLRISNAVTSGSFGDQTFSFSVANEAGETIADSGSFSGGTRHDHFEAEFSLASTQSTEQTGLFLSVSPDRGDGGRMSYLSFEDSPGGIDVTFYDVQGIGSPANFVPTVVASDLSRTEPHTFKFEIDFLDGDSNDVVKIYVDGVLVHTGTTWENYYLYDIEQAGNGNLIPTTDSLIFRASGTAVPGNSGAGYLIDGVALETIPPDVSSVQFVNDPKYVRANNGGDLTAQIVAPTFVTAVNFFVDGSLTPISGSNIGGAGANTDWWRLYTPLSAGEHEISAEVQAYGNWYDVSDTGVVYSIDAPTAEYIIPQVGQTFRPNDKVVRVKVEDEFDQFKQMVVTINASPTTVLRNACSAQGEYLLCDVENLNLPEGTYTASTTTYTKANNRYDNLISESFIIDGTKPTVADLDIENDVSGIVSMEVIASATATDNNAVESVNFYMTEPRISDGACTGNGTKLAQDRVFTADIDSRYRTTLDVSAFADGDYCVTAQSRDEGNSNSAPIHQKVTVDNTAPNVPTHVSPADNVVLTTAALTTIDWTDETDPSPPVTYIYQSSLSSATNVDGSFVTPAYTSGPLTVSEINASGTSDGTYYWHVKAIDNLGNESAWSTPWTIVVNNTPVAACNGSTFDTFSLGSVDGQGNWSTSFGIYDFDQEIVSNNYGFTDFGCQTLRISNAVTSTSFSDQTFSFYTTDEAGEAGSENRGTAPGGTLQNHFEAQFDIASTQSTEQSGLTLNVSPANYVSSDRMSFLSFTDAAGGIEVTFYDVQGNTSPTFESTNLGTLARTEAHTIKFEIDFYDGDANDVVNIYIDGALVHTGTSWEDFYRYSSGQDVPTTNALMFRSSGTAAPANSGNGYLFDNVSLSTSTEIIPSCNGSTATIYVNSSNKIVGGPLNGTTFTGTLTGTTGDDVIVGTSGNDTITGDSGNDTMCGGSGNDNMNGNKGNDYIDGGDGNDEIYGGQDNDEIYGGDGNDQITGSLGDDTIYGGNGNDHLEGYDGADMIKGGDGNDRILGGAGDDSLCGDNDDDYIEGNDGNDIICGSTGIDEIYGGVGDDQIDGGEDDDTIDGGDDTDICVNGEFVSTCEDITTAVSFCSDKAACTPVDTSLIGYWRFDESSGSSTAKDISDFGNDGAYNGPAQSSDVPTLGYGNMFSRDFDGANDVVTIPSDSTLALDTSNTFSVFAWVNADAFSGFQIIAQKIDDSNAARAGYMLVLDNGNPEVWIISNYTGGDYLRVQAPSVLSTSAWTHVGFSYDGSGTAAGVHIFIDGIDVTTGVLIDALSGSVLNTANFEIGGRSLANIQYFDGKIDDVRVFNRVVTDTQAAELYTGVCEDSGAVEAPVVALFSSGGANGFQYRQNQLIKRLNNLGNPSQVNAPTAPAGFGGPEYFGEETEQLDWDQLSAVCIVHDDYLADLYTFDIVDLMSENFAHMFGVSEEFILDIIQNGTYCEPVYTSRANEIREEQEAVALAEKKKHDELMALYNMHKQEVVEVAVDSDGYPVSTDMVWNACIRNFEVYLPGESKPVNCRRYHNGNMWENPDTFLSFKWSPRLAKSIDVRGYEVATYTVDAPDFYATNLVTVRNQTVARRVLSAVQYMAVKGSDILKQLVVTDEDETDTVVLGETTIISE